VLQYVTPRVVADSLPCGCPLLSLLASPCPSSSFAVPSSPAVASSAGPSVHCDCEWLSGRSPTHHWFDGGSVVDLLQVVDWFISLALFCSSLALQVHDHTFGPSALDSPCLAPDVSLSVNALPHFALSLCAVGDQVDQDWSCLHCGSSRSHLQGTSISSQES